MDAAGLNSTIVFLLSYFSLFSPGTIADDFVMETQWDKITITYLNKDDWGRFIELYTSESLDSTNVWLDACDEMIEDLQDNSLSKSKDQPFLKYSQQEVVIFRSGVLDLLTNIRKELRNGNTKEIEYVRNMYYYFRFSRFLSDFWYVCPELDLPASVIAHLKSSSEFFQAFLNTPSSIIEMSSLWNSDHDLFDLYFVSESYLDTSSYKFSTPDTFSHSDAAKYDALLRMLYHTKDDESILVFRFYFE